MIVLTKAEFREYSGYDLNEEVTRFSRSENTEAAAARLLRLWAYRIRDLIVAGRRGGIPEENYSANQVDAVKRATAEYGIYFLQQGDLFQESGFDPDRGMLAPVSELEKIRMPKKVTDILRHAGLIISSIGMYRAFGSPWGAP